MRILLSVQCAEGHQETWEQLAHFEGWEGEDHQSHLYSFAFIILISKESIMYNSCGPKGLTEHLPVRGGCHKHTGQEMLVTQTCHSALYSLAKGGSRQGRLHGARDQVFHFFLFSNLSYFRVIIQPFLESSHKVEMDEQLWFPEKGEEAWSSITGSLSLSPHPRKDLMAQVLWVLSENCALSSLFTSRFVWSLCCVQLFVTPWTAER